MKTNNSNDLRDIAKENKVREQTKLDALDIVMGLLVGGFFYFAYYMLMTKYFKVEPFKMPYLLLSIYFVFATFLFPYVNNRMSAWIEENKVLEFLLISKISTPFSYVFAPIIYIIDWF